jgi:hypothetical protein
MLKAKLKGMGVVTLKPKCQNNTFKKNHANELVVI